MQAFDLKVIPRTPWVNGAGTRQALASGTMGTRTAWWLSAAKIERDCSFSTYPGLARLHVLTSGSGTRLTGDGVDLQVPPMTPVAFGGDTPLECRLVGGPCTAINLIYDPSLVLPDMLVLDAGAHELGARDIAVFCAAGTGSAGGAGLEAGQGAVLHGAATITVDPSSKVLCALIDACENP